jgi:hypothetical protein
VHVHQSPARIGRFKVCAFEDPQAFLTLWRKSGPALVLDIWMEKCLVELLAHLCCARSPGLIDFYYRHEDRAAKTA